ncbi:hypothetical protein OAF37_01935 [Rubripirellula sp.]|nr:hypothetical protein [Rubripirellula sp.]
MKHSIIDSRTSVLSTCVDIFGRRYFWTSIFLVVDIFGRRYFWTSIFLAAGTEAFLATLSGITTNRFKNALKQHPTAASSRPSLHYIFTLIKPNFNFLIRTSKQTPALLAMNHELIAFDINFMYLTG